MILHIERGPLNSLKLKGDVARQRFEFPVDGPFRGLDYRVQWGSTMYYLWDDPACTGYLLTSSLKPRERGRLRAFRVRIDDEQVVFQDVFLQSPWNHEAAESELLCFAVADRPRPSEGLIPPFRVPAAEVLTWEGTLFDEEDGDEDPGAGPCVVPPAL